MVVVIYCEEELYLVIKMPMPACLSLLLLPSSGFWFPMNECMPLLQPPPPPPTTTTTTATDAAAATTYSAENAVSSRWPTALSTSPNMLASTPKHTLADCTKPMLRRIAILSSCKCQHRTRARARAKARAGEDRGEHSRKRQNSGLKKPQQLVPKKKKTPGVFLWQACTGTAWTRGGFGCFVCVCVCVWLARKLFVGS